MASDVRWYDSGGVEIVPPLSFSAAPGVPTAVQRADPINDRGGVLGSDPAEQLVLFVMARRQSAASPEFLVSGLPVLDTRAIEVRFIGNFNLPTAPNTSFQGLGAGAEIMLLDYGSDQGQLMEWRVNLPASEEADDYDIVFRIDDSRVRQLETGSYVSERNGVLVASGDPQASLLWMKDGVITANGPADDMINIPTQRWYHLGVPRAKLAHSRTLDNLDGSAAALVAGEGYYEGLTLGTDLNGVKGDKNTLPLTDSDKPILPDGEKFIAFIVRDFPAMIESGDIEESSLEDFFGLTFAGTNVTVSPGQAFVDGRWVRESTALVIAAPASVTVTAWVSSDGSRTLAATPPDSRALPIWEVTSDGVGVTSTTDLRTYLAPLQNELRFDVNEAPVAQTRVWLNASLRDFHIRHGGVRFALHDGDPSALGNGSLVWRVDLGITVPGGTLTTIYTSGDTEKPTIQFDATLNVAPNSVEEIYVVPAGALLTMTVDAVPATPGAGLSVSVLGDWVK